MTEAVWFFGWERSRRRSLKVEGSVYKTMGTWQQTLKDDFSSWAQSLNGSKTISIFQNDFLFLIMTHTKRISLNLSEHPTRLRTDHHTHYYEDDLCTFTDSFAFVLCLCAAQKSLTNFANTALSIFPSLSAVPFKTSERFTTATDMWSATLFATAMNNKKDLFHASSIVTMPIPSRMCNGCLLYSQFTLF